MKNWQTKTVFMELEKIGVYMAKFANDRNLKPGEFAWEIIDPSIRGKESTVEVVIIWYN